MRVLMVIFLVLLAFPSQASSRTWHVPSEAPTIQAGVDSAGYGDIVEVACGTYSDCTTIAYDAWHPDTRIVCIEMKSGITLRSETGNPACVTVDALEQGGVIFCAQVDDAVIEGITFTGGYSDQLWNGSGGGMFCIQSSVMVRDCVFTGNRTDDHGGGLMSFYCSPVFEGCTFAGNYAGTSGGGAFISTGDASILDCVFSQNTANEHAYSKGAGVFFDGQGSPSMDECLISENIANEAGGGIISNDGPALSISSCVISGNVALYGAGLWGHTAGSVHLANCSITENTADQGGGVHVHGGHDLSAENTDILGNSATIGLDGFVDEGTSAALTCCDVDLSFWEGAGSVVLDNENCVIAVRPSTWGAVKLLYQ